MAVAQDTRPTVVVAVQPQAYFVDRLAGDWVRVVVAVPAGANHATYAPTIDQMVAFTSARLYFNIGHPSFTFEQAWIRKLTAEAKSMEVVDTFRGATMRDGDPHLWVSPRCARLMARNMTTALNKLLPKHVNALELNLSRLMSEIAAVDRDLSAAFAGKTGQQFVVFHAAWGYLAEEYDLVQLAIEEDGKEPDAKQLADLITKSRAAKVDTLFIQPQYSRASADVIAGEIGAEVVSIDPLAYDWPTSLRDAATRLTAALR